MRSALFHAALLLHATLATAVEPAPVPTVSFSPDLMGAKLFEQTCAVCHGLKGEGKEELRTPSIAHQPAYYVLNQLASFKKGRRGTDPADPQGITMAAIAKALSPEQVQSVALHIESMPLVVPALLTVEGADLKEGRWLFEMRCMECHRFNGSGELTFGSPPLYGLQGWYLTAQLTKFKSGHRGAVKGDVNGAKMVFTSSFIENEQMLKDIVGYILTLNPAPEKDPFVGRSPSAEGK
jgi:cytochrome c553